jgi:hypothetical protein
LPAGLFDSPRLHHRYLVSNPLSFWPASALPIPTFCTPGTSSRDQGSRPASPRSPVSPSGRIRMLTTPTQKSLSVLPADRIQRENGAVPESSPGGAVSHALFLALLGANLTPSTFDQEAVAQRPPLRLLCQTTEDSCWRPRPQDLGVRHPRQAGHNLGGRAFQAHRNFSGWYGTHPLIFGSHS